jgi:hypothetical protein
VPWWALVATALVLLAGAMSTPPVRDAATMEPLAEARLAFSTGYLAMGPVCDVLDVLTLLSVRQHIALLVTIIALYAFARHRVARRGGRPSGGAPLREAAYAGALLLVVVAVYAAGALAPRPMAELVISAPEVLSADFHTHTQYSHDGRPGWTPADVRDWHRNAGFEVAYITDHRTFEGAEKARADNPTQAGEGTTLLQGLEAIYRGEHVNILSAGRRYRGLTTADLADVDEQALRLSSLLPNNEPIVIQTIPGNLAKLSPARGRGEAGVRAIEIVDGAPRGLDQTRRERARIVRLADSLDLALVAGSDNHGWGRTAPGWTLLRVAGWRGMGADSLAVAIERVIRLGGRRATRVVERTVADPGTNVVQLALTLPIVLWRMLTTLSAEQRVTWIVWVWAGLAISLTIRLQRHRRRLATP